MSTLKVTTVSARAASRPAAEIMAPASAAEREDRDRCILFIEVVRWRYCWELLHNTLFAKAYNRMFVRVPAIVGKFPTISGQADKIGRRGSAAAFIVRHVLPIGGAGD